MPDKDNSPITWSQVMKVGPIAGLLITAVSTYVALMMRVTAMDENIKLIKEQQFQIVTLSNQLAEKNNQQDIDIRVLETRLSTQK